MRIVIYNGRVVLPAKVLDGACVVIENGVITYVGASAKKKAVLKRAFAINASGNFVSPGFIDTHIHGLPGKIFENEARFGTTSILPTLSCSSPGALEDFITRTRDFIRKSPLGPNVLGVRLEGPFISPKKAGAQDARFIRRPDCSELEAIIKACRPLLRMMTVAPEEAGALGVIKTLRRHRIIASIGHSNASYNEALEGIRAGISHATHTFNAMSGLESRSPGVTGAVLDSAAVTAEVIADLVHVHGSGVEVLLKTKGIDDIIFVTDSVTHARHGGAKKSLGAYRFENGRLAGSCLTMNRAVANAAATLKLSVPEVVRPATLNPARLLGIAARKGSVGVGKDADIVIFDAKFDVKLTMIKGDIIHRARGI